ncbi:MAG: DUF1552 domain-containing protein [Limisphaerales bacterium]
MNRRDFIQRLGLSPAVLPFLGALPALAAPKARPKQRLIFVFTPNGTIADEFWPTGIGRHFRLKRILQPLEPYRDRMLLLDGISNLVESPGNGHVRGIGTLLTARPLLKGKLQVEAEYEPHGWASGISFDQEMKRFLQAGNETRTRHGSLEFGVGVPHRAVPMGRLCYTGSEKPIAPIDDPYQMYQKLYRRMPDRGLIRSLLDDVKEDLNRVGGHLGSEDRELLERHATHVREMERKLDQAPMKELRVPAPAIRPAVANLNDNIPMLSRLQVDMLVNSLANDMTRIATFQYSQATGNERMTWLGINEKHHMISHEPDDNQEAREQLIRINQWYAGEIRYLLDQLSGTPEPGGDGSLLDHTTVVMINELGKGNIHTRHRLPIVLIGGNLGFRMGRALRLDWRPRQMDYVSHHRLLLAIAHRMGHPLETFGVPELCAGGPMDLNGYTASELAHDGPAAGAAVGGIGALWWTRSRKRKTGERPAEAEPSDAS